VTGPTDLGAELMAIEKRRGRSVDESRSCPMGLRLGSRPRQSTSTTRTKAITRRVQTDAGNRETRNPKKWRRKRSCGSGRKKKEEGVNKRDLHIMSRLFQKRRQVMQGNRRGSSEKPDNWKESVPQGEQRAARGRGDKRKIREDEQTRTATG